MAASQWVTRLRLSSVVLRVKWTGRAPQQAVKLDQNTSMSYLEAVLKMLQIQSKLFPNKQRLGFRFSGVPSKTFR